MSRSSMLAAFLTVPFAGKHCLIPLPAAYPIASISMLPPPCCLNRPIAALRPTRPTSSLMFLPPPVTIRPFSGPLPLTVLMETTLFFLKISSWACSLPRSGIKPISPSLRLVRRYTSNTPDLLALLSCKDILVHIVRRCLDGRL
ncbi:hypothetical protein DHEL01_v204276 [Diaporthe helianthi]|uniref:Uncharacterized protein n=1 Tax=Diaporthe helianthi TaxID=158607 RepID=A0A2P5I4D8_DIAHE|nr:hypothetical protein DHEL01_v204276 [Diaporthe helianthi]